MAEIVMPQLGESVTEGTITRWFKQVGESVAEDEPLFEVSTDKVDTEVPAPSGRRAHRDPGPRGRHGRRRHRARRRSWATAPPGRPAADAAPDRAPRPPRPLSRSRRPAPQPRRRTPAPGPGARRRPRHRHLRPPRRPLPRPLRPRRRRAAPGERSALLSPLVRRLVEEHDLDPADPDRHRRRWPD